MKKLSISLIAISLFIASCGSGDKATVKTSTESTNSENKSPLAEQYTEVPKDELIAETPSAKAMYATLTERYTASLLEMKKESEAIGAKFGVVYITPECGNSATGTQTKGKAIIEGLMSTNAIDYADLTKSLADKDPKVVTQMPKDGHLSKEGARLVATDLMTFVKKYAGYMAPVSDNLKSKPAIFGDLDPNKDEILDGGKDLHYRMVTNSQGLRMSTDVTFPKKKQRILLFGDSIFFCPFLDNDNGIAQQLQAMYPDAEIINTANWGYSVDDYVSMMQEKAKFLEPDVVIVQTSGNDILDYYFSNRLKLSRNKANVKPTDAEIAYYNELYKK